MSNRKLPRLHLLLPLLVPMAAPLACGPEAPPPVTPVKPVVSAQPSASAQEALTPVEAPEGLTLAIRLKSAKSVSTAVTSLIPEARELELGRMLESSIRDEKLASLVDVDQPVDMALVSRPIVKNPNNYDRGDYFGASFAIRDDADFGVLQGSFKLVGGASGVQYVVREGKEGQWFHACAVAAALGPAKRRLVCVEEHERKHLDIVLPWLVRGAPLKTIAEDVRVDLYAAPLKKKFENDLRDGKDEAASGAAGAIKTDHAELDRVLRRAAKAAIGEGFLAIDDFDHGSLGVSFAAGGPVVTLEGNFLGATSWFTKGLLSGGEITTPVPAVFGKLPAARASFAVFSRATSQHDALMQPIQTFLGELVEAASADFKWPKADKELALQTVRLMFPKAADTFVVHGRGDDKPVKAAPAPKAKGPDKGAANEKKPAPPSMDSDEKFLHNLREGLTRPTWSLAATDRPLDQSVELSKSWGALLTKPALASTVKLLSEDSVDFKATVKALPAKELKDLPKGSVGHAYEVTATIFHVKDKKRGKERGKIHFTVEELLVPENGRVWDATGMNLEKGELLRRVQDALAGKGTTVSSLPGYAALIAGTPSWGVAFRIGEAVRMVAPAQDAANVEELLGKLPEKGNSVLTVRSSATKQGAGGVAQITIAIPREVFAAAILLGKPERQP
jgi:hypothetical protein